MPAFCFALALFLTAVFALTAPALALGQQAPAATFADILWGSIRAQMRGVLTARGSAVNARTDAVGDLTCTGRMLDQRAVGLALFTPAGRLVKVSVNFITERNDAVPTYDRLVDVLTAKYGAPTTCVRNFKPPYEEGDWYEQTAIQVGKLYLGTAWLDRHFGLRVTERLTGNVWFEPATWDAEVGRRTRAKAADL